MRVSIAVPAYNEERNIGQLLDSLRAQRTKRAKIVEIVVIASGCTDRTASIVRERAARPGVPVRLIEEPERRGKVNAINTYLREFNPHVEAICLCSADLLVTVTSAETQQQGFALVLATQALQQNAKVRVLLQTTPVGGQWVATAVGSDDRHVEDHGEAEAKGLITAWTSATSSSGATMFASSLRWRARLSSPPKRRCRRAAGQVRRVPAAGRGRA